MKTEKIFITLLIFSLFVAMISCGSKQAGQEEPEVEKTAVPEVEGEKKKVVPVEALILKEQNIKREIPLTGVLKPLHSVDIAAEISGKIKGIGKKLGDRITTNDTLAFIDDRVPLAQYKQARSQVLSSETNLKIAKLNLESDKELYQKKDISKLSYENSVLAVRTAEANHISAMANLTMMEKNYLDTRVMSPINGIISRKNIDIGTMVNPGMILYRTVDLSVLKIEVGVAQSFINRVKPGNPVRVKVSSIDRRDFEGTVKYISPQADENTGSFNTEIHVKNPEDRPILAGMTANIDLTLSSLENRISVPDYSVVQKDGKYFVYKIKEGKAHLSEISVGENFGSNVLVTGGLASGDTIVVVGMKNLGVVTNVTIEELH